METGNGIKALYDGEAMAVRLLEQLREACPEPLPLDEWPEASHDGSCGGPETGCDGACMDRASLGSYRVLLQRVDRFLATPFVRNRP